MKWAMISSIWGVEACVLGFGQPRCNTAKRAVGQLMCDRWRIIGSDGNNVGQEIIGGR